MIFFEQKKGHEGDLVKKKNLSKSYMCVWVCMVFKYTYTIYQKDKLSKKKSQSDLDSLRPCTSVRRDGVTAVVTVEHLGCQSQMKVAEKPSIYMLYIPTWMVDFDGKWW